VVGLLMVHYRREVHHLALVVVAYPVVQVCLQEQGLNLAVGLPD
jgi:hypothetical protein